MITYGMKILNYNYAVISDLFNHHWVNVIVKCRKIYGVAYAFCLKVGRLSDVWRMNFSNNDSKPTFEAVNGFNS